MAWFELPGSTAIVVSLCGNSPLQSRSMLPANTDGWSATRVVQLAAGVMASPPGYSALRFQQPEKAGLRGPGLSPRAGPAAGRPATGRGGVRPAAGQATTGPLGGGGW